MTKEYTHDEIAALLAGITQGPWEIEPHQSGGNTIWRKGVSYAVARSVGTQDAQFIMYAPSIVAQLLAECERLQSALAAKDEEWKSKIRAVLLGVVGLETSGDDD